MSTEDEIVDLKAQIKSISSLYDILVENNTKLRNEKATLQQIVLDFQSRYHGSLEQIEELKAENARLREALESIATLGNIFEEKASAQVAREVLKGAE